MNDALVVSLLSVVPKGLGSRLQGAAGRLGLTRHLIAWYADTYGVDTSEMVGTIDDYASLQDFFVRPLKEGARPICQDPEALVSPSDSKATFFGKVKDDGRLPEAAGVDFSVTELVGGDERYAGGQFAILYLSPKDYLRVHHPADATVVGWRYSPGAFWPVFPAAVERIEDLFANNERLTIFVEGDFGRIAVVLVAAYGVGRMTTTHGDIITNTDGVARSEQRSDPVVRGDELGRFNLGSTVILVTEPGAVEWELEAGQDVRVGQRIARFIG